MIERLTSLGIGEATQPREMPPRRSPWFLDNGAFLAWKRGTSFDHDAFRAAVTAACAHHTAPDWIVVPDVVADADATIALAREYVPALRPLRFPLAIVVQDGMTPETFPLWSEADVIFVGGSLAWKLAHAHEWCRAARERGKPCHIGRVGSARRVRWARSIAADSIDSCVPLFSRQNLANWHAALTDTAHVQLAFGWTPPPARELRRSDAA